MQEANATLDALLKLDHCVEVEPDKGSKRAVLNLFNGMTVQLPEKGGFSAWGGSKSKTKVGDDSLIVPTAPRQSITHDQDQFKVLAGDDLPALRKCWEAQARLLGGR